MGELFPSEPWEGGGHSPPGIHSTQHLVWELLISTIPGLFIRQAPFPGRQRCCQQEQKADGWFPCN